MAGGFAYTCYISKRDSEGKRKRIEDLAIEGIQNGIQLELGHTSSLNWFCRSVRHTAYTVDWAYYQQ